jgi:hypothetical protein
MPVEAINPDGSRFQSGGGASSLSYESINAAGGAIGNSTALGGVGLSIVGAADNTLSVILPAAAPGKRIKVYSSVASKTLPVFPPVNSTINGGSANASVVVPAQRVVEFIGTSATNWASSNLAAT